MKNSTNTTRRVTVSRKKYHSSNIINTFNTQTTIYDILLEGDILSSSVESIQLILYTNYSIIQIDTKGVKPKTRKSKGFTFHNGIFVMPYHPFTR